MKLSLPIIILLSFLTLGLFSACNSSDEQQDVWMELTYNNLSVKSFNLKSNDAVMSHLDSVFFSVDLTNARIFNADSLPKGTDIHALRVEIDLPSVSRAMIYFSNGETTDSLDYLNSSSEDVSNDSVNFAHGPVTLSLTSYDGLYSRNYTITVNVHEQSPDSLAWCSTSMRNIPGSLASPTAARTVAIDGKYFCLTSDGKKVCMATTDNIEGDWTDSEITLPDGADVNSLSAANKSLFILDAEGNLFSSTDEGATWSATGARMKHIYGAYDDQLLGCAVNAAGNYVQVAYPGATDPEKAMALPKGCPVEGTSNLLCYTTRWSTQTSAIMTGGRDASGEVTGASWAYDGTRWACISIAPGEPRSGMNLVPYIDYRYQADYENELDMIAGSTWISGTYNVLLAFGGTTADGTPSNEMWISFNRGIHWSRARQAMQLPEFLPALSGASAIVADQTLSVSDTARSRSLVWKDYPDTPLPLNASIDSSWECPYIYIIGGYEASGALSNTIWRGAINRLTYRPLF